MDVAMLPPALLDVDPFSRAFFADPFPTHAALRDAGPVVRLPHYGILAVARFEEVTRVLNDWQNFSSARGVGLSDFAREKPWRLPSLVLETDPPYHDRTRRILNRVLSPAAIRTLRERFAAAADALIDELLERGTFDAVPDLSEAFPLAVFPDAIGMSRENRHHLLPYGNMVFNSFGPRNELFADAVRDAEPVMAWVQRQSQRENLTDDGFGAQIHAAVQTGELTAEEAPMVVRLAADRRAWTPPSAASVPRCIAWPATPTSSAGCARIAGPRPCRLRGGGADRDPGADLLPHQHVAPKPRSAASPSARARRCWCSWPPPTATREGGSGRNEYDITRTHHRAMSGFGAGVHACVGQLLAPPRGRGRAARRWPARLPRSNWRANLAAASTTRCAGWSACR